MRARLHALQCLGHSKYVVRWDDWGMSLCTQIIELVGPMTLNFVSRGRHSHVSAAAKALHIAHDRFGVQLRGCRFFCLFVVVRI